MELEVLQIQGFLPLKTGLQSLGFVHWRVLPSSCLGDPHFLVTQSAHQAHQFDKGHIYE